VAGEFYPVGTSIAYTDSLPLAASALIHPYLWLMILALSAAAAVRYAAVDRVYSPRDALGHFASMAACSGVSAWLLGWFIIGEGSDLSAEGLGTYSMNLLGIFASNGMSSIFGRVPVFAGQTYEGFNYLGAGALALIAVAVLMLIRRPLSRPAWRALWPLVAACGALALLSLSPRIRIGQTVLGDLPVPDRVASLWSIFRATGRLFWPAGSRSRRARPWSSSCARDPRSHLLCWQRPLRLSSWIFTVGTPRTARSDRTRRFTNGRT
jgi:hypothetical protein